MKRLPSVVQLCDFKLKSHLKMQPYNGFGKSLPFLNKKRKFEMDEVTVPWQKSVL